MRRASAILALALGVAACRATRPEEAVVRGWHSMEVGSFSLITNLERQDLLDQACETLRAADRELALLLGKGNQPLQVHLEASELDRAARGRSVAPDVADFLLPARAHRGSLRAELALPREEADSRAEIWKEIPLFSSTAATLVHEAAHLAAFERLDPESRIPAALHEGFAEWIAERVLAGRDAPAGALQGFLWESAGALRGGIGAPVEPLEALILTAPRATSSPRLATAQAWIWVRTLARRQGEAAVIGWLRSLARGEDHNSSFVSAFGDARANATAVEQERAALCRGPWSAGRDVTPLRGGGLLLSPIPGTVAFWFGEAELTHQGFVASWRARCLGGSAPELRLEWGRAESGGGIRLTIPASGRVALELVDDRNAPQHGVELDLGSAAAFRIGTERALRVERMGRTLVVDIDGSQGEFLLPAEAPADGALGLSAVGGAFRIDGFTLEPDARSERARGIR